MKIIERIQYVFKKILFKFVDFELFFYRAKEGAQKKLLIIRIDLIGDFIIFSPMLSYYRKLYSDHLIILLVNKINEELAERFDNVDKIIPFDRVKFTNNVFYYRNLLLKIKRENFNIAIYPTYSREPIGDYLIKISEAKQRIGFDGDLSNLSARQKEKNNKYYTKLTKINNNITSEIEKNRKFLEVLDIKVDDCVPSLIPFTDDEQKAIHVLLENNIDSEAKFAVICPGAGDIRRMWPLGKYYQLINWLKKEKKSEIVVCGSENERYLVEQIKENINFPVADIVGRTPLLTLAAILKRAYIYVGNDTGPAHLAASVGIPTVCIIGGGHPGRFFPWGDLSKNKIVYYQMACFGCDWICKYDIAKCVQNISVDQVINTINQII